MLFFQSYVCLKHYPARVTTSRTAAISREGEGIGHWSPHANLADVETLRVKRSTRHHSPSIIALAEFFRPQWSVVLEVR